MAVVFHDACNTSANYTNVGANTTFGGNNGMFGTLGASGSVHVNFSGSAFVFEGAQKTLTSTATIFEWFYRPASGATIGGGNTVFTVFVDATFSAGTSPCRIDMFSGGSGFSFAMLDASNSYAYTAGTSSFTLGTTVRCVLYQTSAGWYLYLNDNTTPEISYTHTQSTVGYENFAVGTTYQNSSGSFTGVADFDEIWCGNLAAAPSTTAGKVADLWQGYLQNHLSAEGQPYRGPSDGDNLSSVASIDTVSEDASYLLRLAVQNNDQTSFILCDNWVLANLLRSNSTTGNTQNNAAPTNALNLMCFHYNSANTDGKGIGTIYDANFATDAECDRMEALFWAHARWGSSAYTVGSTNELVTPNYLQRALNVESDLRNYGIGSSTATGYNYLLNDQNQLGNTTVQIAPDYNNPTAYKLAAQYNPSQATFWNNTVLGAYDIIEKGATVIFSGSPDSQSSTAGLNPNWLAFNLSTGAVSTTRSTYGDPNYGYNAPRTAFRLRDVYTWYGDTGALTALQEPKSFFTSQWAAHSEIFATFNHDGSNPAGYESTLFTYAAYWALYIGDNSNTTASAINSAKLTGLYVQAPYGSIISEIPSGNQYGYFGQSWTTVGYMQQNGFWTNYGQSSYVAHLGLLAGVGA